jgi:hypothetical protein
MGGRRTPHIIKRAIVCLLLGAIVNVAVAWGLQAYDTRVFLDTMLTDIPTDSRFNSFRFPPLPAKESSG